DSMAIHSCMKADEVPSWNLEQEVGSILGDEYANLTPLVAGIIISGINLDTAPSCLDSPTSSSESLTDAPVSSCSPGGASSSSNNTRSVSFTATTPSSSAGSLQHKRPGGGGGHTPGDGLSNDGGGDDEGDEDRPHKRRRTTEADPKPRYDCPISRMAIYVA